MSATDTTAAKAPRLLEHPIELVTLLDTVECTGCRRELLTCAAEEAEWHFTGGFDCRCPGVAWCPECYEDSDDEGVLYCYAARYC